ncbi:MAG: hypothetical protein OQK51_16525 [Kangiellaceae bacterium]|nr:hypothetical protein [Kangiellaceae bacterium]
MKQVVTFLMAILLSGCGQEDHSVVDFLKAENEWLNPPKLEQHRKSVEIDPHNIFETTASKVQVALLRDLDKSHFISITERYAKYLTGDYFKCDGSLEPYLVRAVYSGVGDYRVSTHNAELFVHQSSLGDDRSVNKSALIICLENAPKKLYVSISKAK